MKLTYSDIQIKSANGDELKAAQLFTKELSKRTGIAPEGFGKTGKTVIELLQEPSLEKDEYAIECDSAEKIVLRGKGIRGLIYAYSHLLRKSVFRNNTLEIVEKISGTYKPARELRGHQAAYRTTPNTYDAWDYDQYFRYYLDIMAFGANICEHNGTKPKDNPRNSLMKYEQYEFLAEASKLAAEVDLDISVWHANSEDETEEEFFRSLHTIYGSMPRVDYFFSPGGDPGSLPADEFVDRCKKSAKILKEYHPDIKIHPSAQAPHIFRDWGERFAEQLSTEPEEIDVVIMGPNHAFPMHELRKNIPDIYPIRFYPDITHNLRCEYPVNFLDDDWHYTYAATLSRESVNPRPRELRTLHRLFSPYSIGSVSYSEGAHDDVNKAVWSALEFNPDADLRDILLDYARFFMYGADEEMLADCILMLEKNWEAAPEESPTIDTCYRNFLSLKRDYPHLEENWRFMLHYFRACCDYFVKLKRTFELKLCKSFIKSIPQNGDISDDFINEAIIKLSIPFTEEITALREELDTLAAILFKQIGIQLDVEHYCADGWERGATLDTIDNNVTDRNYYISKLSLALSLDNEERAYLINGLKGLRSSKPNEIYYSVALHGLRTLGKPQQGEFYMDIQADRPYTRENPLPMSMTKLFDHFSFRANFGGLSEGDYILRIVYKTDKNEEITEHCVSVNDTVIHCGGRFGGEKDELFDKCFLVKGFESASYKIPAEILNNGTAELLITEPLEGFKICELWFTKA